MRKLPLALLLTLLSAGCQRVGPFETPAPTDLPPPSAGRAPVREAPSVPEGFDGIAVTPSVRAPLPPLSLPAETGDIRALWIVRTALTHPDSARAAVRRAHDAGFNTLIVQVRGRGDAWYTSLREPRPDAVSPFLTGYDPLATVLQEARPLGLRVHAWMNMHLIASPSLPPSDSRHLFQSSPEVLAVPRALASDLFHLSPSDPRYRQALLAHARANSSQVEGIYTNPAHPAVQNHLVSLVRDLLDTYRVDGIHLDYIRYPSAEYDYSRASLETFRTWARGRLGNPATAAAESAWARDPLAYVKALPSLWDDFRRGEISRTVERIYVEAKAYRSDIVVSAAVFANADDAYRSRFQEWENWLRWGIVDVVAPMAYTADSGIFRSQIQRAAEVDPRRVWAGVGIYQNTFSQAVEKARIAQGIGVGGVSLFSYDWAVSTEGRRAAGGEYLPAVVRAVWGGTAQLTSRQRATLDPPLPSPVPMLASDRDSSKWIPPAPVTVTVWPRTAP